MARVFWRSFLEPASSWFSGLALLSGLGLLWLFTGVVLASQRLPAGELAFLMTLFVVPAALVVGFPLIGEECRSGTLLLELLRPVTRAEYYTGRVFGRAAFAGAFAAVASIGMVLISSWSDADFLRGQRDFLLLQALRMVSIVMALAALATVSTSRFGHVVYWGGLVVMVHQLGVFAGHTRFEWLAPPVRWAVEFLRPVLLGPQPGFLLEAPLGPWYFTRALVQWGFGIAVAWSLGLLAFERMEPGVRR